MSSSSILYRPAHVIDENGDILRISRSGLLSTSPEQKPLLLLPWPIKPTNNNGERTAITKYLLIVFDRPTHCIERCSPTAFRLGRRRDDPMQQWTACMVSPTATGALPQVDVRSGNGTRLRLQYEPLSMLTFNLGYNVVLDRQQGSESEFVAHCQRRFGAAKRDDEVPTATKNAIHEICSGRWVADDAASNREFGPDAYDIVALQELPAEVQRRGAAAFQLLKSRLPSHFQVFSAGDDLHLLANGKRLGRGVQLTPASMSVLHASKRPLVAVYFADVQLLCVALHMPHLTAAPSTTSSTTSSTVARSLNEFFRSHLEPAMAIDCSQVRTAVVLGDFNADLAGATLRLCGKQLRVPFDPISEAESCCWPEFRHSGDLIFTSEYDVDGMHHGIPVSSARLPLMSDHRPVVSYVRQ